ncbi:MAG TPA: sulfotransferase, partial [Spongiibacteraceae bacterium]|nr:sulfotransferase [Spongiibacteraceae bacterium]
MFVAPRSPLPLRLINGALRATNKFGLARISLDPDVLIEAARRKTGLDDFGEGPFRGNLDLLVDALEREAYLTPIGRLLTREVLTNSLVKQLRLQDWFVRHPEVAREAVKTPMIIIGMPRTGTTILHELMALDPNNRTPLFWEVEAPFPPPEPSTYDSDPRIAQSARHVRLSNYIMPGVAGMHRIGAQLPQECVSITADVFASMLYNTIYRIPTYANWLAQEADMAPVYRYHRRMHQLLQSRCPAQRWVLKSPAHLWSIEALLREYPDAKLVQTHRDPLRIVSSLVSMTGVMRSAYGGGIDRDDLAHEWSNSCTFALNASLKTRISGAIAPQQIVDIQFGDFMKKAEAEVERIYDAFGFEFTPAFAQRIRE